MARIVRTLMSNKNAHNYPGLHKCPADFIHDGIPHISDETHAICSSLLLLSVENVHPPHLSSLDHVPAHPCFPSFLRRISGEF